MKSMQITYQIPGDLSASHLGHREASRREQILNEWASDGTEVRVRDSPGGPQSIESWLEEAFCVPPLVRAITTAPEPDAVIIGCFGDPGLPVLREVLDCPVVGPLESSFHIAAQLGRRVGIVTVVDNVMPLLDDLVRRMGQTEIYAGSRAVNIPVLDVGRDREKVLEASADCAKSLVQDDRADVLCVGCMSMAFQGLAEDLSDALGIPVVNPAHAALKMAESLLALGLTSSRRAYPSPPKGMPA